MTRQPDLNAPPRHFGRREEGSEAGEEGGGGLEIVSLHSAKKETKEKKLDFFRLPNLMFV